MKKLGLLTIVGQPLLFHGMPPTTKSAPKKINKEKNEIRSVFLERS